jgi:hypothetical protein
MSNSLLVRNTTKLASVKLEIAVKGDGGHLGTNL